MSDTDYDYHVIRQFRKKYKWLVWLYQIFFPTGFVLLILCQHRIIPNWCDTFGYFDRKHNYHYLFNIKDFVMGLVLILVCVIFFVMIPCVLKRILKERYIEFLVAKHNGNITSSKTNGRTSKIILLFSVLSAIILLGNIDSITVTDTEFYMKQNILLFGSSKKYTFDYLEDHKPYFRSEATVAFYDVKSENGGLEFDFSIGRYSPNLIDFVNILDEKTDYKYCLSAGLGDIKSITE